MLMMFGHALYKAPFERAMPFNDRDLMLLVSPEYGIRLCNIKGMYYKYIPKNLFY